MLPDYAWLFVLLRASVCALWILQSLSSLLPFTRPSLRDRLPVACGKQWLYFQPEEHPSGGRVCIEGIQPLERSSGFSLSVTLPGQMNTSHVMLPLQLKPTWRTELRDKSPFLTMELSLCISLFQEQGDAKSLWADAQQESMRDLPLMSLLHPQAILYSPQCLLFSLSRRRCHSKTSETVPRWEAASPNFAKCSGGGLALQKDRQSQGIPCKVVAPAPLAWKGILGQAWWSPSWTLLSQETLLNMDGSETTHSSETPNSLSAVTWRDFLSSSS